MKPRFLIDEDVPRSCAERLRERGAFVVALCEMRPRGLCDDDVSSLAVRSDLVLLTGQAGFGDLGRFPVERRPAMIVVETRDPLVAVLGDAVFLAVD